jgi:carbon-monoxide dehydrogenase iron sulfur subunit
VKRIYVREEACIGCHLCEVYCQLQHSRSKDLIRAFKRESPRPLSRVRLEKNGVVSFSIRCLNCEDSPCVYACLTGALSRDTVNGVVNLDNERCVGCWTCLLVCPVGAIRKDKDCKKIAKCDLCAKGGIPACVANCPNEALIYVGEEDKYSPVKSVEG